MFAVVMTVGTAEANGVRVVADVDYLPRADHADKKDRLDLYLPEGKRRFPVVVAIHGGALREGDKRDQGHVGRVLAAAGFGTAIINYRLSPAVAHPAQVEDAAAAVAWVKKNIGEHGGDPDAVFVIGHSAGAYLAALLALDRRYLAAHGLEPAALRGVVPVSAFHWVERVAPDRPKDVWGEDPKAWPDASPARHVGGAAPPLLLLYASGDEDWRRQQNREMADVLAQAGHRDVTVKEIAGRDHGSIWSRIADGDEVTKEILAFAARQLDAPMPKR